MWQMFTPEMAIPLVVVFIVGLIVGGLIALLVFKL